MKRPFSKFLSHMMIIIAGIFMLLPPLILLIYSFSTDWMGVLPSKFTWSYYVEIVSTPEFWSSLFRGLAISVLPIIISTLVVLLVLYSVHLYFPRLESVVQSICMIPHTLQGVILAISVLSLYAGKFGILSNRLLLLTFSYCIIILPYVYQGLTNTLRVYDIKKLTETAQILGRHRITAFFGIILPNIMTGVLISSLLSMSVIFTDFAIVKIVAGSSYITVQQLLYNVRNQAGQYSSGVVVITFSVTLFITFIAFSLQKRSEMKRGRS